MLRFFSMTIAALTFVLSFSTNAHAIPLPPDSVTWTYNFNPGAPAVTADGNPSAGVTFTNEPTKTAVGSSDVVATNLRVFSSKTAASPDKLNTNGAYSLNLSITSGAQTASFSFSGQLKGTFSAEHSLIKNTFTGPTILTQTIGGYNFTVQLISYTPPGPPDQSNAGSISAHVTISNIGPAQVPEPSTILLSGLGLSMMGGAAWRKRRAARMAKQS